MFKKLKTKTEENKSRDPKVVHAAVMLAISCVFIVAAIIALNGLGFFHLASGLFIPRGNVVQGSISEDLPEPSGNDDFNYYVNSNVYFKHEYARGTIMFANPKDSKYSMQLLIYQDDHSSNPLYESPLLSPGEYIEDDKFTDPLQIQKGDYTCIGIVNVYDSDGNRCAQDMCTIKVKVEK